jgi:hypothetical protein
MAAELNLKHYATGATIVALIKGPDRSTRWNGSALAAISTIADASWATGLVPLTELLTADATPTGTYLGDFPSTLAAGEYAVEYYSGASPAPGDEAIALQTIDWDGVAERTLGSVRLAADGLDSISTAAPSGVAATFREMIVQTWRRFFARTTLTATELKTFAADGVTVVTTQPVSDDGVSQTQGAAT